MNHNNPRRHAVKGFQRIFRIRPPSNSYKTLTKVQEKFDQTDGLWQSIASWNDKTGKWMNDPFTGINAELVNTEVQGFVKDAFTAHKKVRVKRIDLSGDLNLPFWRRSTAERRFENQRCR